MRSLELTPSLVIGLKTQPLFCKNCYFLFLVARLYLWTCRIQKTHPTINLGTEISTTKQLSENVAQPGIEPGSPDYRSDALTTQPLNQPHWEHILLYNTYTVLALRWSGPRRQFHTFSAIRITSLLPSRSVMHGQIHSKIG